MAYKRPLVLASGYIQELQAGDSLDASAVNLQFTGLTAAQVLYASGSNTATGNANFTFTASTNTLSVTSLALTYPPTTGSGTSLNLANMSVPRGQQPQQLAFNDMYDAFAYADLAFAASPSPAASSGTWGNIFRASNTGGNGPAWTNPSTITLTIPTTGVLSGSYNLCMVMANASSMTPTNIQIQTTAGTAYSGAPTFLANPGTNGSTWISPTFGPPFSSLGTVTIILTFSGTGSFQLCRLALYSTSSPMDNFALSRDGGTVYGNVTITGTLTQGSAIVNGIINTVQNYYVATTGNDSTGNGSSGNPWATVAKAVSYLSNYTITPDGSAVIYCADGTYTSGIVNVTHPNGDRINVVGTHTYSLNITSVQGSPTGSAPNWSVIVNVSSVANVAVNDYILITSASGGTRYWNILGCHKITNVDAGNTRLTLAVKNYSATPPSGAVAVTGAIVVKTMLSFAGSGGFYCFNGGQGFKLGLIDKVVLVGGGGNVGVAGGYVNLGTSVGITGFTYGVYTNPGGNIYVAQVCASACTTGFYAYSGIIQITNAIANGNNTGYEAYSGGVLDGTAPKSIGNQYQAFLIQFNSVLNGPGGLMANESASGNGVAISNFSSASINGCSVNYNSVYGISVDYNSNCDLSVGSTVTNNGTGVIALYISSTLSTAGNVTSNTTNFSPVINTPGNQEAINAQ